MKKSNQTRLACSISLALAVALFLLSGEIARADAVDDVLASHLGWRMAHPITKAKFRIIAGAGAPVGYYYLNLQSQSPTEVAVMSLLLDKSELVLRTETDGRVGRMFFNEDVYVEFNPEDFSILKGDGFWAARDVASARAALSKLHDIRGTVTKTFDGETYTGIKMELNEKRWDVFRTTMSPNLMVNLPTTRMRDLTIYFGQSGEVHSLMMEGPEVVVEVLFHDWTDLNLVSDMKARTQAARQPPNTRQERWNLPIDEALIKYITKLTR